MQLILLEKVQNLGKLGDVVKVKPGYGRNYLMPYGKAVPASKENLAEFESRRAELERAQSDALERAQARAEQLSELTVVVASKVGMEGKLYGSVSSGDIASALNEAEIEISKSEIRLPDGPIRQIGDYEIAVHLHPDVDATVHVQVIAEE